MNETFKIFHTADLVTCLNVLCGQQIEYTPAVKEKDELAPDYPL